MPKPMQMGSGTVSWTLSAGDGPKTVYAQFRFLDGSLVLGRALWSAATWCLVASLAALHCPRLVLADNPEDDGGRS